MRCWKIGSAQYATDNGQFASILSKRFHVICEIKAHCAWLSLSLTSSAMMMIMLTSFKQKKRENTHINAPVTVVRQKHQHSAFTNMRHNGRICCECENSALNTSSFNVVLRVYYGKDLPVLLQSLCRFCCSTWCLFQQRRLRMERDRIQSSKKAL